MRVHEPLPKRRAKWSGRGCLDAEWRYGTNRTGRAVSAVDVARKRRPNEYDSYTGRSGDRARDWHPHAVSRGGSNRDQLAAGVRARVHRTHRRECRLSGSLITCRLVVSVAVMLMRGRDACRVDGSRARGGAEGPADLAADRCTNQNSREYKRRDASSHLTPSIANPSHRTRLRLTSSKPIVAVRGLCGAA